jgi:hypothetical protein
MSTADRVENAWRSKSCLLLCHRDPKSRGEEQWLTTVLARAVATPTLDSRGT